MGDAIVMPSLDSIQLENKSVLNVDPRRIVD